MTALAFSEQYLFAGQGPYLKVHRREDARLLETHAVFASQAVHGFVVSGTTIVVWGGHFISIYTFSPKASKTVLDPTPIATLRAEDWILDVSVSPYANSGVENACPLAAVLTAHNALLILDLGPQPSLRDLTSTSRCILYAANLCWLDPNRILVASGTVFGEVILWSCSIEDKTAPKSVLHQLLSGHDGSIFGVRIFESPLNGTARRASPMLATCSDDRTIRVWDISDLPDTPLNPQAAADLPSARETGFGSNIADFLPDKANSGHCIAKAWGHASRIWDVRFLPSESGDQLPYLISFGEDATSQFWKLVSPSVAAPGVLDETHSLTHLLKTHVHSGKNIWSSAVAKNSRGKIAVATGGADGSIVLSSHDRPITPVSDSIKSWSIETISSASPTEQSTKRPDKLRGYAFVTDTSLIVSTDSGNVFLLDSQSGHAPGISLNPACTWISQESSLRGYSVVTSIDSLSVAFLAGMDGTVLMFDANSRSVRELTRCLGKTAALFARQLSLPESPQKHACLLVTNVESKTATLLKLSGPSKSNANPELVITAQWTIELPAAFIVTGFLLIPSKNNPAHAFSLILGSRSGTIAIFDIPEPEHDTAIKCSTVLDGVHGRDAVTDLAWVVNQSLEPSSGHLFSVGRDGTFVILAVCGASGSTTFQLVNRTQLPLGTLVEGLYIGEDHSVICWGFHSKQFIVIDMIKETRIMSVDCGGANRIWRYEPSQLSGGSSFAWIKASQLCLSAQVRAPLHIHDDNGHGREIKAVAVRPSTSKGALPHVQVFATGSEDTNIKILVYEPGSDLQFHCLRTLRKHNTGIQHLQWSSDGQYLFSSGGFEEFFVWKMYSAPLTVVGVVCESICPAESELPDLRIMNFSARQIDPAEDSVNASEFVISMVRSDSTLRVYSYHSSPSGVKWHLLSAGNYLTSCLTQCLDVDYIGGRTLITAGTDGHVALWPTNHKTARCAEVDNSMNPVALRWTLRHKIHQNTIHCLLLHWIVKDRDCVLITTGDDNAFAVTRCTWSEGLSKDPQVRLLLAHSSFHFSAFH